jgi:hypothetical protein
MTCPRVIKGQRCGGQLDPVPCIHVAFSYRCRDCRAVWVDTLGGRR